jgi:hypothetical protein
MVPRLIKCCQLFALPLKRAAPAQATIHDQTTTLIDITAKLDVYLFPQYHFTDIKALIHGRRLLVQLIQNLGLF